MTVVVFLPLNLPGDRRYLGKDAQRRDRKIRRDRRRTAGIRRRCDGGRGRIDSPMLRSIRCAPDSRSVLHGDQ